MNKYDYLAGTHDLESLSAWGPFARDLYALSHIADHRRGIKFDFLLIPGILRRSFFPPETLRECGCSPYEAAPDLSYFSFRQQLEGQDLFYADSAYAQIAPDVWLGRCEFVNNTAALRATSLLCCTRLAPRPDVIPHLPENSVFVDALDYSDLVYAYERFDHHLTTAGGRRGEQNFPGTVNNRCIGAPYYDNTLPCFGAVCGDRVNYEFKTAGGENVILIRCRVDAGEVVKFKLSVNGESREVIFNGTGEFELLELYRGAPGTCAAVELCSSADGCGIRIDGFVVGSGALTPEQVRFAPPGRAIAPRVNAGTLENSNIVSSENLGQSYCVWWSRPAAAERDYWVNDLAQFVNYSYGLRHPFYKRFPETGDVFCHDSYILPVDVPAGGSAVIYTLYSCGSNGAEASAQIAAVDRTPDNLEKLFQAARTRAFIPRGTTAGQPYEFSQQLMAATSLTNVNFPISTRGRNIRHHVPDKFFNSLYSWDSGFIGLGFLELDKIRAIENLNVYVTDPGAENAFLLYGTPMPVHAYLYMEIWNRWQDRDMLSFFYPRLLQYYKFIGGHFRNSTYRKAKSNILCSWDYFYNSGGWDDYPPQWRVYIERKHNILPAVTTAHAIRFAKILKRAALELGINDDLELLNSDIAAFTKALQEISWSGEDGVFSYVEHDAEGNPVGAWLDPESGVNYNFGMDGASPLVSGICTAEQRDKLFARLSDPEAMWTDIGISTVDKRAPYFRTDGYWNGCVWMPHQWFFWKAALDDNRTEFARRIAETALKLWKNEVDQSRYCFEHFSMSSHRGAGCCHFGGLSSPVLNWYAAYCVPGRFTGGFDCWITGHKQSGGEAEADLDIDGSPEEFTTVLYVAGDGRWQAEYNGVPVKVESGIPGCLEMTLPKGSTGKLKLKRIDI